MFEVILELILEIIFEGSAGLLGSKKVPMILRILIAAAIPLFFITLSVFLLYVGITDKRLSLIIAGLIVIISSASLTMSRIKEYKNRNKKAE